MSPTNSGRAVRTGFFGVLLAVFGYLTLSIVDPFSTYLLAVFLLAFLLWPLQQRLAGRIGPRLSAVCLIVGSVGVLCLVGALLLVTLPTNTAEISAAIDRVLTEVRVERRIERILGVAVPVEPMLSALPNRVADLVVGDLSNVVGAATDLFLGVVLFVFLLYYLLTDGDQLVAWVRRMIPLPAETTDELVREGYVTTWAVLEGHVLVAVVQGVVAGVGLLLVGIPHVVFWTVVMMLLELVPVVGVAAVLVPAVVYLGFSGRYLAAGFLLVYGLSAVALVDDYLRAYIVDQGSSMHSATILVGVFGGVYAFGVMGLFYGPIVLGLSKTLVRLFNETYDAETAER